MHHICASGSSFHSDKVRSESFSVPYDWAGATSSRSFADKGIPWRAAEKFAPWYNGFVSAYFGMSSRVELVWPVISNAARCVACKWHRILHMNSTYFTHPRSCIEQKVSLNHNLRHFWLMQSFPLILFCLESAGCVFFSQTHREFSQAHHPNYFLHSLGGESPTWAFEMDSPTHHYIASTLIKDVSCHLMFYRKLLFWRPLAILCICRQ